MLFLTFVSMLSTVAKLCTTFGYAGLVVEAGLDIVQ